MFHPWAEISTEYLFAFLPLFGTHSARFCSNTNKHIKWPKKSNIWLKVGQKAAGFPSVNKCTSLSYMTGNLIWLQLITFVETSLFQNSKKKVDLLFWLTLPVVVHRQADRMWHTLASHVHVLTDLYQHRCAQNDYFLEIFLSIILPSTLFI